MVFVKFHNMKEEKKIFLMSPLNSNKLKNFHFTTSQNHIAITVHKCSVFCFQSMYYFTKNVCSFFLFFSICCVQQCSSSFFFFFFVLFFHCPLAFCFCFGFHIFLSFFFIINCSFNVPFFSTLYLPLSVPTLI